MTAWSGGAYDTLRDRLIVWGGGHLDYGGNEIYAFDIATMTWSMVIGPTITTTADLAENNPSDYYHDGRPSSRHTANALAYSPNLDQFFSLNSAATYGNPPHSGFEVDSFNFTTGAWKTDWIKSPGHAYGANSTIAAYHPRTGKIWYHATFNSPLAVFDPSAPGGVGAWTTYASQFLEIEAAVLLDDKRNRLIAMGQYGGVRQFFVWDLNNPNNAPTSPVTSGVAGGIALESKEGVGFFYDPIGDRYIAWNGGRAVYALDPTTWVWSAVALDSSNTVTPTIPDSRGTYGRMQYIPSKHAFVVVNRTTENVYFFKLSSGSTPLPTVALTASASSVDAGGNATLTWSSTNATSCTASGAWSGSRETSGSQALTNLTTPGTYTLTCSGAGGSGAQSISISVDAVTVDSETNLALNPKESSGQMDVFSLFAGITLWTLLRIRRFNIRATPSYSIMVLCCAVLLACAVQSARAGDITTVELINRTGTLQTNGVVTFGHYFRAGDVPAGYTVQAKKAGGVGVELQVDKKATHVDGSLRHAILTVRLNLAGNSSELLTLSSVTEGAAGTPVTLDNLQAAVGFDAQVSLNIGGTVHSASAQTLIASGTPQVWLSGPLVSEWIVGGPVKTAGGAAHTHLHAYFHVRAYAGITRVNVDLVVENNWTLVAGPADRTYDATLSVGGNTVYSQTGLTHYSHTRWHKRAWWGGDPQIYAKLNTAYLQDSKAIPKYETLAPTEGFLNSVRQSTAPMDNGDQTDYMDNTGAQDAIGPLPRWDAVYAVSADPRAFNYMRANADGGAAYPIHFRNEATQLPVTIDSYPNASLADPVASIPLIPVPSSANPHDPGSFASHQPSIGYLSYLVTGDYYYLEEMQFWSAYNLIWVGSAGRAGRNGYGGTGATGLWYDGTIRGIAWAYRNLAQAASITPDLHPLKSYFTTKLNNNIAYDTWQYVAGNSPTANSLGAMYSGEKDSNNEYRGFYDNFMSWAIQYVVDLGYSNAIPFRDYKLKMPIGLMGLASNEFCFQFAPQYNWILGPANSTFYTTFKEVYDATVPGASAHVCGSQDMANYLTATTGRTYLRNEMIGGQSTVDYYFANTQIALAAAADSGLPGGSEGWARSQLSGIHPDYRDMPTYALIPRGNSAPTPSVTLVASSSSVASGGSTSLSWSSVNATSCIATGQWSGSKATAGTETLSNITRTSTYTLTCAGNGGSGSATTEIELTSNGANDTTAQNTLGSGMIDPGFVMLLLVLTFFYRLVQLKSRVEHD